MFQSPDGDFVYSDPGLEGGPKMKANSFNPLTGISSILTICLIFWGKPHIVRFNPLTGISSILTQYGNNGYQSLEVRFNPLTGISSILTCDYEFELRELDWVSIP